MCYVRSFVKRIEFDISIAFKQKEREKQDASNILLRRLTRYFNLLSDSEDMPKEITPKSVQLNQWVVIYW